VIEEIDEDGECLNCLFCDPRELVKLSLIPVASVGFGLLVKAEAHIDERGSKIATSVGVRDAMPSNETIYSRIENIAALYVSVAPLIYLIAVIR
jgi:hypothetical protein